MDYNYYKINYHLISGDIVSKIYKMVAANNKSSTMAFIVRNEIEEKDVVEIGNDKVILTKAVEQISLEGPYENEDDANTSLKILR
ncbi:hypothetical protein [Macrococcoides caseolyticum]|uniref:Uncharacterized protein n=1 Tax=Macrococcoides caseolyticum TaxID=69966 RepID=A0A855H4P7_9STAP|nr:hypothetical protein [Macrococcus caseolyticus]PKE27147.1 hypothetical protein CW686_01500 [Macrococcus caseolyticus]PKE59630.1 hypothetical protein CW673_01440 [Macrococcus caseolyticus]PKE71137.1 hypothetical protein CW662_01165 [Macrococcus caseolyticus]